jgi:nitrate/TMAO reductase-like tetraheme cytochrome c subunit
MWKKAMMCGLVIFFIAALVNAIASTDGRKDDQRRYTAPCSECHTDTKAILPKVHPTVDLKIDCMTCHKFDTDTDQEGLTKFGAIVHKQHEDQIGCLDCHLERP